VAGKAALRAATAADETALRDLLRAAALPDDLSPGWFPSHAVVAIDGDRVVGAAAFEPAGADALLRSVVVAPAYRGGGVGERLARERLDAMRRGGMRGAYLLTTDAATWFARLGFVEIDRAAVPAPLRQLGQFASLCPASARCLRMALGLQPASLSDSR
jgi:N-acetylglutamate synthase-like GNAT family acetyltransferase